MLYNCKECRNWHSGVNHICGDPAPDLRDQRALEQAVVKCARVVNKKWIDGDLQYEELNDLDISIQELNSWDRPLRGK